MPRYIPYKVTKHPRQKQNLFLRNTHPLQNHKTQPPKPTELTQQNHNTQPPQRSQPQHPIVRFAEVIENTAKANTLSIRHLKESPAFRAMQDIELKPCGSICWGARNQSYYRKPGWAYNEKAFQKTERLLVGAEGVEPPTLCL